MDELEIYNQIQAHVQLEIKNALAVYSNANQFTTSNIPIHVHGGTDSPQIDPRNLLGFPIMTAVPTDNAPEGTIRLALIAGTYYIYARINQTWKRATLT